jgi:hypothetical protein
MTRTTFLGVWLIGLVLVPQLPAQVPPAQAGNSVAENPQFAAPKPGHPLDQRDVDILTGRADAQRRSRYPWVATYPIVDGTSALDTGLYGVVRPGFAPAFRLLPEFLPFVSPRAFRFAPSFRPFAAPRFGPFQFRRVLPVR